MSDCLWPGVRERALSGPRVAARLPGPPGARAARDPGAKSVVVRCGPPPRGRLAFGYFRGPQTAVPASVPTSRPFVRRRAPAFSCLPAGGHFMNTAAGRYRPSARTRSSSVRVVGSRSRRFSAPAVARSRTVIGQHSVASTTAAAASGGRGRRATARRAIRRDRATTARGRAYRPESAPPASLSCTARGYDR